MLVMSLDIRIKLPRKEMRCFGDRVQAHEILQGSVTSDKSHFSVKVVDSETNKQLHYTYNEIEQKFSYLPNDPMQVQICVHNIGHVGLELHFVYNTGLEAQDYTQLAQMEDLVEMQQYVKSLNVSVEHLKIEQKDLSNKQNIRSESMHRLSTKIIVFSLLTVLLMIAVTIFQTYKASHVMKLRKSI